MRRGAYNAASSPLPDAALTTNLIPSTATINSNNNNNNTANGGGTSSPRSFPSEDDSKGIRSPGGHLHRSRRARAYVLVLLVLTVVALITMRRAAKAASSSSSFRADNGRSLQQQQQKLGGGGNLANAAGDATYARHQSLPAGRSDGGTTSTFVCSDGSMFLISSSPFEPESQDGATQTSEIVLDTITLENSASDVAGAKDSCCRTCTKTLGCNAFQLALLASSSSSCELVSVTVETPPPIPLPTQSRELNSLSALLEEEEEDLKVLDGTTPLDGDDVAPPKRPMEDDIEPTHQDEHSLAPLPPPHHVDVPIVVGGDDDGDQLPLPPVLPDSLPDNNVNVEEQHEVEVDIHEELSGGDAAEDVSAPLGLEDDTGGLPLGGDDEAELENMLQDQENTVNGSPPREEGMTTMAAAAAVGDIMPENEPQMNDVEENNEEGDDEDESTSLPPPVHRDVDGEASLPKMDDLLQPTLLSDDDDEAVMPNASSTTTEDNELLPPTNDDDQNPATVTKKSILDDDFNLEDNTTPDEPLPDDSESPPAAPGEIDDGRSLLSAAEQDLQEEEDNDDKPESITTTRSNHDDEEEELVVLEGADTTPLNIDGDDEDDDDDNNNNNDVEQQDVEQEVPDAPPLLLESEDVDDDDEAVIPIVAPAQPITPAPTSKSFLDSLVDGEASSSTVGAKLSPPLNRDQDLLDALGSELEKDLPMDDFDDVIVKRHALVHDSGGDGADDDNEAGDSSNGGHGDGNTQNDDEKPSSGAGKRTSTITTAGGEPSSSSGAATATINGDDDWPGSGGGASSSSSASSDEATSQGQESGALAISDSAQGEVLVPQQDCTKLATIPIAKFLPPGAYAIAILDPFYKEKEKFFHRFRAVSEFVQYMSEWQTATNALKIKGRQWQVEMFTLGKTGEDKAIKAIEFGNPHRGRHVFVVAGLRGCDWVSPLAVIHTAVSIVGRRKGMAHILDAVRFHFVPLLNVDGYHYSRRNSPSTARHWCDNRRVSGGGHGVNLERNWGVDEVSWGFGKQGKEGRKDKLGFQGLTPFSEPEVKSLRDYVQYYATGPGRVAVLHVRCCSGSVQPAMDPPGKFRESKVDVVEGANRIALNLKSLAEGGGLYQVSKRPENFGPENTGSFHDWARSIGVDHSYILEVLATNLATHADRYEIERGGRGLRAEDPFAVLTKELEIAVTTITQMLLAIPVQGKPPVKAKFKPKGIKTTDVVAGSSTSSKSSSSSTSSKKASSSSTGKKTSSKSSSSSSKKKR